MNNLIITQDIGQDLCFYEAYNIDRYYYRLLIPKIKGRFESKKYYDAVMFNTYLFYMRVVFENFMVKSSCNASNYWIFNKLKLTKSYNINKFNDAEIDLFISYFLKNLEDYGEKYIYKNVIESNLETSFDNIKFKKIIVKNSFVSFINNWLSMDFKGGYHDEDIILGIKYSGYEYQKKRKWFLLFEEVLPYFNKKGISLNDFVDNKVKNLLSMSEEELMGDFK